MELFEVKYPKKLWRNWLFSEIAFNLSPSTSINLESNMCSTSSTTISETSNSFLPCKIHNFIYISFLKNIVTNFQADYYIGIVWSEISKKNYGEIGFSVKWPGNKPLVVCRLQDIVWIRFLNCLARNEYIQIHHMEFPPLPTLKKIFWWWYWLFIDI